MPRLTFDREYCKERWDEALEISRTYLHPKTFEDLKQCDTCEKLLEDLSKRASEHSNRTIPLLLQRVAPALGPLRNLTNILVLVIRGNTVAVAAVWGVIHLLIQVRANILSNANLSGFINDWTPVRH
jgi:hypothetical protein